jgi:hypothetical protein
MNRGQNNVVAFGPRAARPKPAMMRCPVASSMDISQAIVLLWELREQLRDVPSLTKLQRTRFKTLGCHIEDRLERAVLSMEPLS